MRTFLPKEPFILDLYKSPLSAWVLIDNGFALNVCLLRTALIISLDMETIIPSLLTVRAYDNTSRKVMGAFKAPCKIGPLETFVEFHIMDITLRKGMASPYWGHPLFFTPKDEDPIEGRSCCSVR